MALAAGVVLGAELARPVPLAVAIAGVGVALTLRHPWLVCLSGLVLASALASRALAGLDAPERHAYSGTVTLLSDPEPGAFGTRAEVRAGGRHLEAWASGAAAGALVDRLSGERVTLQGTIVPLPDRTAWLTARHVAGRLEVGAISGWARGNPASTVANGLRRTLVAGADGLPEQSRILFTGFVLGDDRGQSPLVTDDFRGSGLTHLLAVSGENVAFVLVLLGPGLRRLTHRPRLVATLAALGFFALLTRFEPSVLRATAMAAIATLATVMGREASGVRVLALAVAALVIADPLLVGSVGFQLSVAASAGIVVLSPPLLGALPGPDLLRLPVVVTIAAQVGVAPVLLTVFGGLPVVSLVANLLAGPAAGPIMVWGVTAGVVAGMLPPPVATLLHLPTHLLVGWVALVARHAVAVPLGQLTTRPFVALALVGAVAVLARHRDRRLLATVALVVAGAVLLSPALSLRFDTPPPTVPVGADAELWRSDGRALLALGGRSRAGDVLEALREAGVVRLDVVVCHSDASSLNDAVALLRSRYGRLLVLAPSVGVIAGAEAPAAGATLSLGQLDLQLTRADGALDVVAVGGGERGPV